MDLFDRLDAIGFPKLDLLDRDAFCKNLVFMHALMVASEPLLQEAIEHSDGALGVYYSAHIEEERGHAAWLADDLKSLGVTVGEPSYIAAACAGAQYYLIRHAHPAALLGYLAVLEGYPAPLEVVDMLEGHYGKDAMRCFRFHAEHDVDHRADLVKMIESVPEHHDLITNNAVQTLNLLHIALR